MDGGLPVVGDFDGDGIDDLGVFRDSIWSIFQSPGPLLDDLSVLTRPTHELDIFQFGDPEAVPLPGSTTGLLRGPDDDEIDEKDDFAVVQWGGVPTSGCAPSGTPCGVVFQLDWWEASGMAAFVIDANGDGSADLLVCPAGQDGLVASGPLDCWLLDDLEGFINEALFP